jgi:hypothetical protein
MGQPVKSSVPTLNGFNGTAHSQQDVAQVGEHLAYTLGLKSRRRLVAQGHSEVVELALELGLLPFASVLAGQPSQVRPHIGQEVMGDSPTVGGQLA